LKKLGISIIAFIAIIGFLFFDGDDIVSNEISLIGEIKTTIEEPFEDYIKGLEEEAEKAEKQKEEENRIVNEKYIRDIATKVHQLINEERRDHGLGHLSWNGKLAQAALNHSTDMALRNYFQHESPEGYDFSWRYSQVGFSCNNPRYLGAENIMFMEGYHGVNAIAAATVDGWMNSPGHRANILISDWRSEGVGVAFSGNKAYLTQNFC
tara:strand:- start:32 stop:658 length:627 start_codon:yes stop_codon:yes gene_type:complete